MAIAKKIEQTKQLELKVPSNANYGTGRRKEATARVWIFKGSGRIVINGQDSSKYFKRAILGMIVNQPLVVTNNIGRFDIYCTVKGSGPSGQSQAIRHGVSRALVAHDEELRTLLKPHGFLTRDPRVVERKKYGLRKARRRPQFSKR